MIWKKLPGLILVVFPAFLLASTTDDNKSIFDLMHYQEVLELTLETDLEHLKNNRTFDEYQPAVIQFKDGSGIDQIWQGKVKLRGRFRRVHCSDIPPLKLKFKKSDLAAKGLAAFNDMKLVPQCIEDEQAAQDFLKREYLAYKMYSTISDYSYRVQMLRITYIDSNTGKKDKQWAFLIEDTAQLRDRLQANTVEQQFNIEQERFNREALKQVALFQYMIGNSDWSLHGSRNVKMLEINGQIVPVPYDFDFSGFVNASYAVPNPNYLMTSTQDRIYLGFLSDLDDIYSHLTEFRDLRDALYTVIQTAKICNASSRADMQRYLDSFYQQMNAIKVGIKKPVPVLDLTTAD